MGEVMHFKIPSPVSTSIEIGIPAEEYAYMVCCGCDGAVAAGDGAVNASDGAMVPSLREFVPRCNHMYQYRVLPAGMPFHENCHGRKQFPSSNILHSVESAFSKSH